MNTLCDLLPTGKEAGDVIFGETVKTVEGYAVLNFEVDSFSSSEIFKKIVS